MLNRSRVKSNGFTLIELVLVMAATTLLAGLMVTLLHAMLRQQAAAEKQLLVGTSLTRLADRFRLDVLAAKTATVDAESITLTGDLGTTSYRRPISSIVRRSFHAEGRTHQDDFDLQDHHALSFRVTETASHTLVQLQIQPPDDLLDEDRPRYAVSSAGMTTVAELGRDARWMARPIADTNKQEALP